MKKTTSQTYHTFIPGLFNKNKTVSKVLKLINNYIILSVECLQKSLNNINKLSDIKVKCLDR